MTAAIAVTSALLVIVPVTAGALIGVGVRRVYGARPRGVVSAFVMLLVPAAVVVAGFLRVPLVGCWDAAFEGLLLGSGVLLGAHRAFAGRREIALCAGAVAASLLLLESAARWLLPPAPAFPSSAGVHLRLAAAIRAAGETQAADMISREFACSVIYGTQYSGLIDVTARSEIERPDRYVPRPDATRRVLHIGDSMVFGLGVARGETFIAELRRLEPDVEHINGGIPGLAPDGYFAVLERWLATQRFDAVVMYVFEGNDLRDLDGPFPCCGWEPLLAYDSGAAGLRCTVPTGVDLRHAGFEWLRYNSPPPYLLRVLIDSSSAAAYASAAMVEAGRRYSLTAKFPPDQQMLHFTTILRTAGAMVAARGGHFSVVILPDRNWVESREPLPHPADRVMAAARGVYVPVLDASPLLKAAVQRQERIFIGEHTDPHFNAAGHRLIAQWLHRERP